MDIVLHTRLFVDSACVCIVDCLDVKFLPKPGIDYAILSLTPGVYKIKYQITSYGETFSDRIELSFPTGLVYIGDPCYFRSCGPLNVDNPLTSKVIDTGGDGMAWAKIVLTPILPKSQKEKRKLKNTLNRIQEG